MSKRMSAKYIGFAQGMFGYAFSIGLVWAISLLELASLSIQEAWIGTGLIIGSMVFTFIAISLTQQLEATNADVTFWCGVVTALCIGYMSDELFGAVMFSLVGGTVFLLGVLNTREMAVRAVIVFLLYAVAILVLHRDDSKAMGQEMVRAAILLSVLISVAMSSNNFKRFKRRIARVTGELEQQNSRLELLSRQLAKYLSPQIYKKLFSESSEVHLGSSRKKLTVFFSDIVGFTEYTDRTAPEEMTQVLNRYLTEMAAIALRYGGTIDKYAGDSILVFFGDPDSNGERDDALACVRMAIEMQQRASGLLVDSNADGLQVRMGINSGFCTVGNFGSEDRFDYTIMGRTVNVANRLESAADSREIWISENTYDLVEDVIACQPLGAKDFKGLRDPINVYRVIAERQDTDSEMDAAALRLEQVLDNLESGTAHISNDRKARILERVTRLTQGNSANEG